MPTERAEYVVPCSTESQFSYLWPTPLHSAYWMPIAGDPGAHEMGVPVQRFSVQMECKNTDFETDTALFGNLHLYIIKLKKMNMNLKYFPLKYQ